MPIIYSSISVKFTLVWLLTLDLEMSRQRGLKVTSSTEKLNFAAPKMGMWSLTKAGYSFPSEGGGMGRPKNKEPNESPIGSGWVLQTQRGRIGTRTATASQQWPLLHKCLMGALIGTGLQGPVMGKINERVRGHSCSFAPTCLLS